jgi:acyl-CoA thioesterase-1
MMTTTRRQMVRAGVRLNRRRGLVLLAGLLLGPRSPARAAAACRLAVLGDSLTAAYGLPLEDGFPARLEAALRARGHDCVIIDAGVSGDTSAGGRARLDWVLADRPTHLLVELGANDALRALPPEQLEANLDAIVTTARGQGVSVMIAGMLAPPNLGDAYGEAFALAYRRVAERHGVPLYPFFLDGVAAVPELNQADGIHPNAQGVREIVARILPAVEAWLVGPGSASSTEG